MMPQKDLHRRMVKPNPCGLTSNTMGCMLGSKLHAKSLPNKQLSLELMGSKQGHPGSAVRTHQQQHSGLNVQSTGQGDAHTPAPAEQVGRPFLHDLCEAQAVEDLAGAGLCRGCIDLLHPLVHLQQTKCDLNGLHISQLTQVYFAVRSPGWCV